MKRDRFFGTTMDEWIQQAPAELDIDAVGLWQIVSFGREGFDLSGNELVDYVRRYLLALLTKGAKPVIGATDGVHDWIPVEYGSTPDEMAGAVIDEWLQMGRDPDAGDIWFALPHMYEVDDETASGQSGS